MLTVVDREAHVKILTDGTLLTGTLTEHLRILTGLQIGCFFLTCLEVLTDALTVGLRGLTVMHPKRQSE